ncbi:MAG: hypothetical protein LQ345_005691 [Seirophora villosa]|nr:MAG: hypothetical protein LQ345_005691 [Seirophora villosa]
MRYVSLFVVLVAVTSYRNEFSLAACSSRWTQSGKRAEGSLDSFIASEAPIALRGVLDNIDFYTWTRDSALTLKLLVDTFIAGDASLQPEIEDYIHAQAIVQTVANPSGDLTDGTGLGEPKFEADLTAFTRPWGRPQRDGPALRATTLITYSRWLLANGGRSNVTSTIWPIISNDLSYVGEYWNRTGFDLWEEVEGSSFFTTAVQHRALVEGQALAEQIGKSCLACESQAPEVLCFQQSFWNGRFIVSNINNRNGRNGRDANSILASIHSFDPDAGCDDTTFQPCSSRALANHKEVTDSFRSEYAVNSGIPEGVAVAVGRYTEDVYFGGNPWYLTTSAAAEQLYAALYQINRLGRLDVDATSLPFFQDLDPTISVGSYPSSSDIYTAVTSAVKAYADGYLSVVQQYTPPDGRLSEQYSRDDGSPLSAADLTWSYAAFITATDRRSSIVPPPWGASAATVPPASCAGTSAPGTYVTLPITCAVNVSEVAVTFNVREPTIYGETVYVSGSAAALGGWDTAKGLELNANRYTSSDPLWSGTARSLPAGGTVEYKYYKTGTDGVTVTWEGSANRMFSVPEGCQRNTVRSDVWQP